MRAHTLPATAGWRWITGGFTIFRRNPPMLGMLVVTYWVIVLLLNIFPVIGMLLASMAIPGLSVGLMQASKDLERGQVVGVQTLLGGLKENRRTLFALGALYLCCTLAILGISALFDDGHFIQAMFSAKPGDTAPEETDSILPMLVILPLLTPLLMAYWFAPVLAAWHGLTLGRSLFFSFVACWLNWRAFLVYSGGLALLAGVLPSLLLAVLLTLFPGLVAVATALVLVPMLLVFVPTVFASFYVSYRDIFGVSEIV